MLFRETIFNICSVKCAKSLISGGFQALLQVLFIFDVTTEGIVGQLRGSGVLLSNVSYWEAIKEEKIRNE